MKLLVVLLVVVFVGSCYAKVGEDPCTWGPAYWCKDEASAKECSASEYCRVNVWNTKEDVSFTELKPAVNTKSPETDLCDMCKLIVKYIQPYVDNNATEPEIQAALEAFCKLLGPYSDQCSQYVSEYLPMIFQLLKQEVDTGELCNMLHLCNSTTSVVAKPKMDPQVDLCSICKVVANFLKNFVDSNSSEEEVEKALEDLCSLLPANYSTECKSLVDEYFPFIWALAKSELDSGQICVALKLCNSTVGTAPVPPPKAPEADLCQLCKQVVDFLKPFVDSNATEEEAQAALDKFCSLLPQVGAECKALVDQYFPLIWKLVQQEIDSGQLCVLIGLCPSSTKQAPEADLCQLCKQVVEFLKPFVDSNATEEEAQAALDKFCSLLPQVGAECKALVDQYFPLIWKLVQQEIDSGQLCVLIGLCPSSTKQAPEADLCQLCKQVVDFLKPFVDSNATEEEAQAALDKFCSLLPQVGAECKALVDQYFPLIWKLVQQEIDSGQLCVLIGLCPSSTKQVSEGDLCQLCKLVVNFLKPFLDSNATEDETKAALEKFCTLLTPQVGAECKTLVNEYFAAIWRLIDQEIDSGQLCVMIGMCPSSMGTAATMKKAPRADLCQLCEMVTSFLKPYVDNNATEAEALAALEKVCGLLPSTYSQECDAFVKQYFPMIWKYLQAEIDSDQLCKLIGLCPSSPVEHKKAPRADLCQLCEMVTSFLKPYVDNNATEAEALAALEKVCGLFPSTFSQECDAFVKQYFPMIWKFLQAEIDSDQLCKLIGLCPSSPVEHKKAPQADLCDDCKRIVNFLKPFVDSNATEDEAKAAVEELCKLIPSFGSALCNLIVDKYFDDIWKLLRAEVDTDKICQQLHLCPSSMAVAATRKQAAPDDIECDICGSILKYVYSVLAENATEGEIEAVLNKVCTVVPQALAGLCKDLVDKYTKELIQYIEDKVPPDVICEKLGFCSSVARAMETQSSIECTICELILKYAEEYLGKNSTEAEIEAFLDKVCDLFPVGKSECEDIVKQYLPELIAFIQSELPPDEACQKIGLCSGLMAAAARPKGEAECDLCTMVLKYVDAILSKNSSEAEIVALLDKVCGFFPAAIQQECVAFVNTYAKDIIPLIVQELDPEKICTMIGLCPKGWTSLEVAAGKV